MTHGYSEKKTPPACVMHWENTKLECVVRRLQPIETWNFITGVTALCDERSIAVVEKRCAPVPERLPRAFEKKKHQLSGV